MPSIHWIHNAFRNWLRTTFVGKVTGNFFTPSKPASICFVAATRLGEAEFWAKSPLGLGLQPLLGDSTISTQITFNNAEGLPAVYNRAIHQANGSEILVFLHDDIWLEDPDFIQKIIIASKKYDVIGVAGNTRISKFQPAWLFRCIDNGRFIWDSEYLSGSVRHGTPGLSVPAVYGPTPARCELMDGVFLAGRRSVLLRSKVFYDEKFRFHFYDMDFCRTARRAGLSLGTWPLDILHVSQGAFGSPGWREGYAIYFKKWKN
jgi:glycosyltransferase involved in cell wall biosynthesis